jgi:hypothetical protein
VFLRFDPGAERGAAGTTTPAWCLRCTFGALSRHRPERYCRGHSRWGRCCERWRRRSSSSRWQQQQVAAAGGGGFGEANRAMMKWSLCTLVAEGGRYDGLVQEVRVVRTCAPRLPLLAVMPAARSAATTTTTATTTTPCRRRRRCCWCTAAPRQQGFPGFFFVGDNNSKRQQPSLAAAPRTLQHSQTGAGPVCAAGAVWANHTPTVQWRNASTGVAIQTAFKHAPSICGSTRTTPSLARRPAPRCRSRWPTRIMQH